jgi:hypothetical protein
MLSTALIPSVIILYSASHQGCYAVLLGKKAWLFRPNNARSSNIAQCWICYPDTEISNSYPLCLSGKLEKQKKQFVASFAIMHRLKICLYPNIIHSDLCIWGPWRLICQNNYLHCTFLILLFTNNLHPYKVYAPSDHTIHCGFICTKSVKAILMAFLIILQSSELASALMVKQQYS